VAARRNQVAAAPLTDDRPALDATQPASSPAISSLSATAAESLERTAAWRAPVAAAVSVKTLGPSNNGDSECDRWADSDCLKAPPLSITATLDQTD